MIQEIQRKRTYYNYLVKKYKQKQLETNSDELIVYYKNKQIEMLKKKWQTMLSFCFFKKNEIGDS